MKVRLIKPNVWVQEGVEVTPHTAEHYGKLIGKTIDHVVFEMMEGQPLPILVFSDKTHAAVLQDPEGNGPGHLDLGT